MYVYSFTSTPDKENNIYYLGPAPLEDMARYIILLYTTFPPFLCQNFGLTMYSTYCVYSFRQIATANGPCGNNRDYLFLLEKAMHNLGTYIHYSSYMITFKICKHLLAIIHFNFMR